MGDESIRDLERATVLAPADRAATLRLARALARAGRRREALDRLDLATWGDLHFEDAKQLSDELWLEELSRLEPVLTVRAPDMKFARIDLTGQMLVWHAEGRVVRAASVATGETVFEDRGPVDLASHCDEARGMVFLAEKTGGHLKALSWNGGNVRLERHALAHAPSFLSKVDPSGARVLVTRGRIERHFEVYAWPTLERILRHELEGPLEGLSDLRFPYVDWDTGHLLLSPRGRQGAQGLGVEVVPLDGSPARSIGGPAEEAFAFLARPGIADVWGGVSLRLEAFVAGWTLPILEWTADERKERGLTPSLSLASDGRGVRLRLGGKLLRLEVDLARGKLVRAPEDLEALARGYLGTDAGGLWHPHADVAFVATPDGGRALTALDGRVLLTFPEHKKRHWWAPDAHGICVICEPAGEAPYFELWRARP